MKDPTEIIRRQLLNEINAEPGTREALAKIYGQIWDTEELAQDFHVKGFMAPFVLVQRNSDRVVGTLTFQHHPRFYFSFNPDN